MCIYLCVVWQQMAMTFASRQASKHPDDVAWIMNKRHSKTVFRNINIIFFSLTRIIWTFVNRPAPAKLSTIHAESSRGMHSVATAEQHRRTFQTFYFVLQRSWHFIAKNPKDKRLYYKISITPWWHGRNEGMRLLAFPRFNVSMQPAKQNFDSNSIHPHTICVR